MTTIEEPPMDDGRRHEQTVRTLLATAGLDLPDDDVAGFVAAYAGVRAGADLLHAVEAANELDGALVLRPDDAAYGVPVDGNDTGR